ncbi:hypothetical protein GIB67_010295 [Kingdonia uniflora]|uniref:RNase H type-1 domain-containing protein n=1 Tax=Kingdonia uniflora TaxID=39325 RepID=A0A7J7LCX4_9MAGN|nr:hypothetical protein GIB67_010295 [Kingdonia uniflora]
MNETQSRLNLCIYDVIDTSSNKHFCDLWKIRPKFKQKEVKYCKWSPPAEGVTLLSTDGSITDYGGFGGVFRDFTNKRVLAFGGKEEPQTITYHEMKAISRGLDITLEHGLSKLIINTDSSLMVQYIKNGVKPPWRCKDLLANIKDKSARLEFFDIVHIYREINGGAHFMASHQIDLGESLLAPNQFPTELNVIRIRDGSGHVYVFFPLI